MTMQTISARRIPASTKSKLPVNKETIGILYRCAYHKNRKEKTPYVLAMIKATTWVHRVIQSEPDIDYATEAELKLYEDLATHAMRRWLEKTRHLSREAAEQVVSDFLDILDDFADDPASHEKHFWHSATKLRKPAGLGRVFQEFVARGKNPYKALDKAKQLVAAHTRSLLH